MYFSRKAKSKIPIPFIDPIASGLELKDKKKARNINIDLTISFNENTKTDESTELMKIWM